MRAVIVYESMFGATREIAEAISEGLGPSAEVELRRAAGTDAAVLDRADLLVVGCPTHAWSMPRSSTRSGAPEYAHQAGRDLVLEPGAETVPGVREFLAALPRTRIPAAAFDTRIEAPRFVTGRASRAVARALAHRGARLVLPPESFMVDKKGRLLPDEHQRARSWGERLSTVCTRVVVGGP
jgi:hypothetical protein